MKRIVLRLPEDLYQRVQQEASREGVSINQYLVYSITRAVTAREASAFFKDRAHGTGPEQGLKLLDQVPNREPMIPEDRLIESETPRSRRKSQPTKSSTRRKTSPARRSPKRST